MDVKYVKLAARCVQAGVLAGAAVLALGAGPAMAQSPDARARTAAAATSAAKADPADTRVYVAERKIVRDSATGELRRPTKKETAELVASLKQMLSPDLSDVAVSKTPDGGGRLALHGRFQEVMLARPAADGTMETRCVSSMEEAAAFLGLKLVSGDAPGDKSPNNE